jgi:hypothetical protein
VGQSHWSSGLRLLLRPANQTVLRPVGSHHAYEKKFEVKRNEVFARTIGGLLAGAARAMVSSGSEDVYGVKDDWVDSSAACARMVASGNELSSSMPSSSDDQEFQCRSSSLRYRRMRIY